MTVCIKETLYQGIMLSMFDEVQPIIGYTLIPRCVLYTKKPCRIL